MSQNSEFTATRLTWNGQELLLVQANGKYIVAESDLVHYVRSESETVTLQYTVKSGPSKDGFYYARLVEAEVKLADLLACESGTTGISKSDLAGWIHYFGIKDRVHANYYLLCKSLREIGVNPSDLLPDWG